MNKTIQAVAESTVTVRQVEGRRMLRSFVGFPDKLYRHTKEYIPPFYSDELEDWNPKKNPAFEYCDAKGFLAYKNGRIVGRIGAIVSHKANEKWGRRQLRFSCVDFIDDYEVSAALFAAVEDYARQMGCDEVHGPLGFTDLDREGMLVEGYDRRSMFITYYCKPYYIEHLTRLGYGKSVDWVENLLVVPEEGKFMEMMGKLSARSLERYGLHVANPKNKRELRGYVKQVFELVNIAYAELYGTVDLTDKQIERYANKFLPMIKPEFLCMVLDKDERLVAFGVVAPSMANAIKKCRGRLFPFGWMGVLKALRKNDTIDMFLVAVHPDYQSTGINSVLIEHIYRGCRKHGIKYAETGPTLETNLKVQAQWKMFSPFQHKRRRCFIKKLDD